MNEMRSRRVLVLFCVGLALLFSACAPQSTPAESVAIQSTAAESIAIQSTSAAPAESAKELALTPDELKSFNGKDGQPAYVAVDGVIYDLSGLPLWKGGTHNGQTAGQDQTNAIDTLSPHGRSMLSRAAVVGRLVQP